MSKRQLKESDKKIVAFNQEWKCKTCTKLLPSTYQIDHIIPFSISFNDNLDNLTALCPNCHSKKTQQENFRINNFKKLCSTKNTSLCWFCLEELNILHDCDKILKKIILNDETNLSNKNSNILDKFIYSNNYKEEVDTTLYIKINNQLLWINKFFTTINENTNINDIVNYINIATRSKKESNFYEKIEIHLNLNPYNEENCEIPDDLVDHINEFLPKLINKRILKNKKDDIDIIFILN
jgi:hypothetical protein